MSDTVILQKKEEVPAGLPVEVHHSENLPKEVENNMPTLARITSYNVCYTKLLRVPLSKLIPVTLPLERYSTPICSPEAL